jgi:hypothetical protein
MCATAPRSNYRTLPSPYKFSSHHFIGTAPKPLPINVPVVTILMSTIIDLFACSNFLKLQLYRAYTLLSGKHSFLKVKIRLSKPMGLD